MLSSSRPDRQEARLAARLDVLTERVDTLASTVATTASAIAKKDGELAALRRELDARDARLADFVTKAREASGGNELRELKEAVAALARERSREGGAGGLDDLSAKVALLGQRLETVSTTVSTTAAGLAGREGELAAIRKRLESLPAGGAAAVAAPDPALVQRVGDLAADVTGTKLQLDGLITEVAALRTLAEQRPTETALPSDELREMLVALRSKVEAVAALRAGASEEQLEERFARADERVGEVARRVDALAATIDTAVTGLADKERELAALHRHLTESGTRIESIVEDIRDALSAFPEPGSADVDEVATRLERLAGRVERCESSAREHADANERLLAELRRRIETIESQLAAVSTEVARAKTLWPVALRSLEARLEDVGSHVRQAEPDPGPATSTDDDDLLAGLRDSLQAMESVAAEMTRASDVLAGSDEPATPAVAAGGATIVPLRSSDG